MRKESIMVFVVCLCLLLPASVFAQHSTSIFNEGDVTPKEVFIGYDGIKESLGDVLARYVDPITGQLSPILTLDGRTIITGNVDLGENPAESDQIQIQSFRANSDNSYKITYLGFGSFQFSHVFGYYTFSESDTLEDLVNFVPLFDSDVDMPGDVAFFDIPAGQHFAFYLDTTAPDFNYSKRFFSQNRYNLDGILSDIETGHMLAFDTNKGLLFSWEDLPFGSNLFGIPHRLGDQDYEDMIVGMMTYTDGSAVIPEPSSLIVLATGTTSIIGMAIRRRMMR